MRVTVQNPGNISRLEPSATAGDKYLIFPKDQIRCPEKKDLTGVSYEYGPAPVPETLWTPALLTSLNLYPSWQGGHSRIKHAFARKLGFLYYLTWSLGV